MENLHKLQKNTSMDKGEKSVAKHLDRYGIEYIREKTFNKCKRVKKLRYDFYLPKYNMCIEYDGKQHFYPQYNFGNIEEYEEIIKRDKIKNEFCEENKIFLLRISYKDFSNIDKILDDLFSL